jgi:hypothetical protein
VQMIWAPCPAAARADASVFSRFAAGWIPHALCIRAMVTRLFETGEFIVVLIALALGHIPGKGQDCGC